MPKIMTDYNVLWADVARDDLDDIANYIAEEDGIDTALDIICRLVRIPMMPATL